MRKLIFAACLGLLACSDGINVEKAEMLTKLKDFDTLTADGLLARANTAPTAALGYDPASATWLDSIQKSALALNEAELSLYKKNGFVISGRQTFAHFFDGYKAIYAMDLPVYVSADSILYALHKSYDGILKSVEEGYLEREVQSLLNDARARISSAPLGADAHTDLECLLGVAALLLNPNLTSPNPDVATLVERVKAASGVAEVALFGTTRDVDFSQFKPRGHYDSFYLSRYFQAMMWLGRIEFRLVDVDELGNRKLNRRETEDVLAMAEIVSGDLRTRWTNIDKVLSFFVGEADYMPLPQADDLRKSLGIASSTDLGTVSDADLLGKIDVGNYGVQRIASQLMVANAGMTTLPNSFALFGQRYTIDSHVFSQVVYPVTKTRRMMPNPLDVAYAALGNDQAAVLLKDGLASYAPNLAKARQLVDWHDEGFWTSNLYTSWLGALRELSPGKQNMAVLPKVARTEAWGRRLLNTQLASWSELRHDTLLYAKQSFTGIPTCEYPDGYVDPYPALFKRLKDMGNLGADTLTALVPSTPDGNAASYLRQLAAVAGRLESMAQEELTGATRTPDEIAFLNDAVTTKTKSVVCATIDVPSGWYTNLFFNRDDATKQDPVVADVHTQPADKDGNIVGHVLHVATSNPRLMVVSVDSCAGQRAYAGVVSAYHEQITSDFNRMTDQEWFPRAISAADVDWMNDVIAR
jgi:hypothetical protein